MFFRQYKNKPNRPLTVHHGIFRPEMSLFEGIALMTSGTIGAGVLGIPFVVAQVGMQVGLVYILVLGLLMMGLNLMLGEVSSKTGETFQLVGLARKYLGRVGALCMTVIVYAVLFGVLVVYIIGEGETLANLFGGSAFNWSILFFAVASAFVIAGMHTIKIIELVLTAGIFAVVILIAGLSSPHVAMENVLYTDLAHIFLPYGVILFAFHGTTAIPEMHSVLQKKDKIFQKAIIVGGALVILVYVLFALSVVGVTGQETTEIATIGLGQKLGPTMFVFGNVFAFFAMATSFLLTGVALRDSLMWDYKMKHVLSVAITLLVPLFIFLLGLRAFIVALDIVGGVFGSIEMLLILFIYWQAKRKGDLKIGKFKLHHTALLGALLLIVFLIGAVYSVGKLLG